MLKQIATNVYYMPHYAETDRPALGLICGENFSLAIDAGNSPAHATDFLDLAENMDITPIKLAVITHWHWDHIFGMKTVGRLTISHQDTKRQLEYLKTLKWDDASLDKRVENGEEIAFCRDMMKREMPVRDYLELQAPDITFQDTMQIDLGGITCVMEHVGGEHARDSSIVYIPEEKVMFLGDCIYQDFYSGEWSYDLKELQILLEKIKKYDVRYYVLGHQSPKSYDELWHFLDELLDVGEIVGDETSPEKAVERFQLTRKIEPTKDQLEFIGNFVAGNQKK
ncbi:MBL fold metallo-hydrolase [Virgibacillus sp. C22-A2]|uniref:MBL fold metallo-hydrolase n=1 Tax=Virgibacillus tibetensis TaxID=3042313 RepID=A0ABU6KDB2_9BACI|nr:MBL fold metallo-hydrolase [Virgibacillus sp. C22-A2]